MVALEGVTAAEYRLLRACAAGRTLVEAAQAAQAADPDFELAAALRRRVQDQTITAFSLDRQRPQELA